MARMISMTGPFVLGVLLLALGMPSAALAGSTVVRIGDGVIPQPSDSEPMIGLELSASGEWQASGEYGSFVLPLIGGESAMQVQAQGYQPVRMSTTALVALDAHGELAQRTPVGTSFAAVRDHQVRYANVLPGVDEVASLYQTRLKHEVVLRHGRAWPAATRWAGYEAELTLPAGYTLTTASGEPLGARNATLQAIAPQGTAPYSIPEPLITDAAGDEITGHYVVQATDGDPQRWQVRVLVDSSWLAAASYPVRIDPTIQIPAGTGSNAIPFRWTHDGTWQSATYQQTYSATQMTMGGTITHVGVRFTNTINRTFDRIEIRLGETSYNASTSGTNFNNNFNVVSATSVFDGQVNFVATSNGYDSVQLQTPFNYSGTNTLVVEYRIHPGTNSGSGMASVRTGNQQPENWRLYTSDYQATTGTKGNFLMGAEFTLSLMEITQPPNNTIPGAYEGESVSEQFQASGGTAPYTFDAVGGMPAGVTLSSSGLLSGTLDPNTAGSHTVDIEVTDSTSMTSVVQMDWEVYATPVLDGSLDNATVGFTYNDGLNVIGGKTPFTWALTGATPPLPATLSLNPSTGNLQGTPVEADVGSYSLTFEVTDDGGYSDSLTVSLEVDPAHEITLTELPDATETAYYSTPITVSGGRGPFNYSGSGLPSGVFVNASTGVIAGTLSSGAAASSPYSVTITVTDANNATDDVTLNLVVNEVPQIVEDSLPSGLIGAMYESEIGLTGGSAPLTWTALTELPEGLELNAETGVVAGIPSQSLINGEYEFDVSVVDANGASDEATVVVFLRRVVASGSGSCATPAGGGTSGLLAAAVLAVLLWGLLRRRWRSAQPAR